MHSPFDLLALLLVLSAGLAYLNCRFMKLPMTVGLLVGAAAGTLILIALDALLPGLGLKPAIRDLIIRIDFPAALLDGFLAFLLFAGALQVNSADLLARKWTILALAILATVLSAGLTAAAMFAASRWLGLGVSFPWCLVFGALISPTDPVSVLDVLKRIGIPRGLQATVAGESLFNDGIGVVLFTLALSLATGDPIDRFGPATIASLFLLQAVGGGLLGLGFGYLTHLLVRRVDDYNVELIISLALASGTYSAAGLLGVSGPIAVVVAGIIIGNQGMDGAMGETTRQHLMTFWRLVEEILNALLFLTIGLEIASIDLDVRSIIAAVAMIPVALVIRWFSVAVSALPLNLRLPHRYGGLLVLTWGGLRGGLSVAMALSLPDGPNKGPILTVAYGIVVFSIVVQGLTLERVARGALSGGVDALSR
nr:sodium:proton antiporter [uncultured Rhodopila sp.]